MVDVFDVIDSYWTLGGSTNISNLDTDCSMLPDNYTYTGMAVSGCRGETISTFVQCEVDTYPQGFAIWVDWNQNDIFEPAEKVYASPDWGDEVWEGSFTIPMTTTPGETYNMRVRSNYVTPGALIDPCALQTWGETEDYLVIVDDCSSPICEGDTAVLDLGPIPPGPATYVWTPAVDISDPAGGPTVEVWPSETTTYTCLLTTVAGISLVTFNVVVVNPSNPNAGLDDSLCLDPLVPFSLNGTLDVPVAGVNLDWEFESFVGDGSPTVVFDPDDNLIDPSVLVNLTGTYEFILNSEDIDGLCPVQSDTVFITLTETSHTTAFSNPSCFGVADGNINVTGIGTFPIVEYSIDGGLTWQASNSFNDLGSGSYLVVSRDESGCEFASFVTLTAPEEIVLTLSSDTLVCQNGTATLIANASGGLSFTYEWSIPGTDESNTQSFLPIENPTIVTVKATNEIGCSSEIDSITVFLADPLELTISPNDAICIGESSEVSVEITGGNGDYFYSWTANGAPFVPDATSFTVTPLTNTYYCVTANDGCESSPVTACTEIIVNALPYPVFTADTRKGCNPTLVNFETSLLPSETAEWLIDGENYVSPSVTHEFTSVGFYDVFLEITNEFGCMANLTETDFIEIVEAPNANFFISPNPTTIFNTTVALNPLLEVPEYTYFWEIPGATPANSTDINPTVVYPEGIASTYEVTLIVTNEIGCVNATTAMLEVLPDLIIYAPNVFTPDGNQLNNTWRIYMEGIDVYNYNCKVFNRWGEIVWESFDVTGAWNGTYDNQLVPAGVYVWVVNAKDRSSDKVHNFSGSITVIK